MAVRHIQPARGSAQATPVSIQELLEWAFRSECAQLEFDEIRASSGAPIQSYGAEYLLIQRQLLGCKIDGGGRSEPHPDAEIVASAVAALPVSHGGRPMAIRIAELARAGMVPDWAPGARMICEPVQWQSQLKHGRRHAKTVAVGKERYVYRGRLREYEVRLCPVRFRNDADYLASLRREYLRWWSALRELRETFRVYGGLSAFAVTGTMPVMWPWTERQATS